MNFMTAVKIARWMARAYGYVAKKRKAYLKEAKVTSEFLNNCFVAFYLLSKRARAIFGAPVPYFERLCRALNVNWQLHPLS